MTYPLLADPAGDLDGRARSRPAQAAVLALVDEDGKVAHQEYVELESRTSSSTWSTSTSEVDL